MRAGTHQTRAARFYGATGSRIPYGRLQGHSRGCIVNNASIPSNGSGNGHAGRAVLYARVSGDDTKKDGRNLAGQLDMGRECATQRGYVVVAELAEDDRGASGASWELPQLNRALEMARKHEYEVFIVREIDRLSRDLVKQLTVERELKRAGVSIQYVLYDFPNTPEGNFMKQVRASVAELERGQIAERMRRGMVLKVQAGSVMLHNHPIFGTALWIPGGA
jgi:site-specific DNA recombinase